MGTPRGDLNRIRLTHESPIPSARKRRAWDSANAGNVAIRAELVATAFEVAGYEFAAARRILDVGCGTGWWLERLAEDGRVRADLHGVELLAERAAAASARVPDATVADADARELPFAESEFDVVTLFTVLSSIGSADGGRRALREAARVLAPAGLILIWEPRVPNPANSNTRLVTPRALRAALPDAQFEMRTTTVVPALSRHLGRSTDRLYPLLRQIPLVRTHRLVCVRGAGHDTIDAARQPGASANRRGRSAPGSSAGRS